MIDRTSTYLPRELQRRLSEAAREMRPPCSAAALLAMIVEDWLAARERRPTDQMEGGGE